MPTRQQSRRHRERAEATRLMLSRETALQHHLARVIRGIGKRAAYRFSSGGYEAAVASLRPMRGELSRVLRPSLYATAKAFSLRITQIAKSAYAFEAKAFEDLDAEIEAYIAAHTASRVVDISESLRKQIAQAVRDGFENQLSAADIAKAIREATSGEMAAFRARRIAITETHTASQVGQFAAAQASPLDFAKIWLATEDKRTREAHAAADGQRVALDEPFIVGGEELMFPGDPEGSASQIINCRCVCSFEPIALRKQRSMEA